MAHGPILILAQPDDDIALRVHAAMLPRWGRRRVRFVSDRDLVSARRWDHRIAGGRASTEIELSDGSRIVSTGLGAVLNRLRTVPAEHFALWQRADAAYAIAETHALWLSWLEGIDAPVFNRPTARGLSGAERGQIEWHELARTAGFLPRGWQLSTNARRFAHATYPAQPLGAEFRAAAKPTDAPLGQAPAMYLEPIEEATTLVTSIDGRVIGPHAAWWRSEFLALHELTSEALLQAIFALRKGGLPSRKSDWRLCHVVSRVDVADAEVINAIVALLERSAAHAKDPAALSEPARAELAQS